jgi:DNA invertase Pin-like site-specific DNA recombinase
MDHFFRAGEARAGYARQVASETPRRALRAPGREKRQGREGEHETRQGRAERQAAAYVRVSSASQTASMQRHAIERAAHTRGEHVSIWYADSFTGGGAHPPELVRMLDDARHGKISTLYVYRLDRLSRRGIRDTFAIVERLRAAGTKIRTLADGFDVDDGPATEVVLAVLAWAAQMERQAIGERISAARRRVEAKGGNWGRPKRMTAEQVKKAEWLHAAGKSHRYIAQVLRVPKATIGRCLKNGPAVGPNAAAKTRAKRLGVPLAPQ